MRIRREILGMPAPSIDPEFTEWAESQPSELTSDPLWRLIAYRHAAFVAAIARGDAERLAEDPLRAPVAAQLLRSATSIAANVAEGYGRPTAPDRIRYFSYALGSLRETASWYEATGKALSAQALRRRLGRLATTRRILLGLLTRLRTKTPARFDSW